MKKKHHLFVYLLFLPLLFPALGDASYIIELDTGARFLTPLYWEEQGEVRFFILEGMVGIEKKYVKKIEEASALEDDGVYVRLPKAVAVPAPPKVTPLPVKQPAAAVSQAAPLAPSPEVQGLRTEFAALQERFKTRNTMASQELLDFVKDMEAFRDKVLAKRLGSVLDKELQAITDMGGEIEDLYKARRQ